MSGEEVKLPPDQPNWPVVKELLQDLQAQLESRNITEQETGWFMQTIYTAIQSDRSVMSTLASQLSRFVLSHTSPGSSPLSRLKSQIQSNVKKKLDSNCVWFGLAKYLSSISKSDREHFLYVVLPRIIEFAIRIEEHRPKDGFPVCKQQKCKKVTLSRQFVCSVIACFFLSLFPERIRESSKMNIVNFTHFFKHLQIPSQVSKLKCVLHYFQCMIDRKDVAGNIIFTRKAAAATWMLTYDELLQCDISLCPLQVHVKGVIEDSPHAIQVDFANKSIGGGVLGKSRVQEEIKFSVCPELLSAMLFMENMDPNEAIAVSGFEQFSCYKGYAESLEFAGHYHDPSGARGHKMVAIDAISYRTLPLLNQYQDNFILRDLNKAVVGFCRFPEVDEDLELNLKEVDRTCDDAADVVTSAMRDAVEDIPSSELFPVEVELHGLQSLGTAGIQSTGAVPQATTAAGDLRDGTKLETSSTSGSISDTPPHADTMSQSGDVMPLSCHASKSLPSTTVQSVDAPQSSQVASDSTTSAGVAESAEPAGAPCKLEERSELTCSKHPNDQISHVLCVDVENGNRVVLGDEACCRAADSGSQDVFMDVTAAVSVQSYPSASPSYPSPSDPTPSYPSPSYPSPSDPSPSEPAKMSFHESQLLSDILGNLTRPSDHGGTTLSRPVEHPVISPMFVHPTAAEDILSPPSEVYAIAGAPEECVPVSTSDLCVPSLVSLCDSLVYSDLSQSTNGNVQVKLDVTGYETASFKSAQRLERTPSDLSALSLVVNVGSQSLSTNSAEEESTKPLELLSVSVEDEQTKSQLLDTGAASFDSVLPSMSPQSSGSSAHISPNTSMTSSEPLNSQSNSDFFQQVSEVCGEQYLERRSSRDFYGELREFLNSSSSGSRSSASGGPNSSSNSTWGSRSGSISSHGTNGSCNDFVDFWNNFRRRSSQLSDTTSRRSSSSKHSSDFSTDLEEISEGLQKYSHGIIEEEGGLFSMLTDFASQVVSTAVSKGVATAVNINSVDLGDQDSTLDQVASFMDTSDKMDKDSSMDTSDKMDKDSSVDKSDMDKESSMDKSDKMDKDNDFNLGDKDKVVDEADTVSAVDHMGKGLLHKSVSPQVEDRRHEDQCPAALPVGASGKSRSRFSRTATLVRQEKLNPDFEDSPEVLFPQGEGSGIPGKFSEGDGIPGKSEHQEHQATTVIPAPSGSPVFSKSSGVKPGHQSVDSGFISVQTSAASLHEPGVSASKPASGDLVSGDLVSGTPVSGTPVSGDPVSGDLAHETIPKKETSLDSHVYKPSLPSSTAESTQLKNTDQNIKQKPTSSFKSHSSSHIPKAATSTEVHSKSGKAKRMKSVETAGKVPSQYLTDSKLAREAAAASVSESSSCSMHVSVGASGPSRSSGIPKFKNSSKSLSETAKCSSPPHHKARQEDLPVDRKDGSKANRAKKQSKRGDDMFPLPQKSRYIFSDVAPPLREKKHRHKDSTADSPQKKHGRNTGRKSDDKKRPSAKDSPKKTPSKDYTKSPKFIRFVNSLAEISVSQAVLEGAEILTQAPHAHDEISDEVYNWFATKIINEVFFHVLTETREQDPAVHLDEIGASGDLVPSVEVEASRLIENMFQTLGASATDTVEVGSARQKSKGILPAKSDMAASSCHSKVPGSLKVVKFKESYEDDESAAKPAQTPANKTNSSTPFRISSSIPIPVRRKSSLDLPLVSPPVGRGPGDLSSDQQRRGLASVDLSLDIYQTAASIVNQVFQTISDSMDAQVLSPGSSCRYGTVSSSDAHSTGSRIHSHYDSFASNIFSSSSMKTSESPRRSRRSVSPSIGVFFRKPMSRETLTNAFLKVDHSPQIKSYERRSSEPCQTSVQLSLQAFNNNKFSGKMVEDKNVKVSRTDDDIGRGKTWRRGSLEGFSFDQRRNSCGFKDPVLSRFAEELMKADTSVPELVIVGSHASSSSTGSRRSSMSAFRDSTLANLENELLNTSFTSACSMSQSTKSHRKHKHLDRSRSRESRQGKSDSSDTEYWFPPPRFVGEEFQQEYNRQHSQDELQDYASYFAGRVVQEAVCVLQCEPEYMSQDALDVDMFAENLSDQIMRDVFISSVTKTADRVQAGTDIRGSNQFPFGEGAKPKTSKPKAIPLKKGQEARSHKASGSQLRVGKASSLSESPVHLQPPHSSQPFHGPRGVVKHRRRTPSYPNDANIPRTKRHSSPSPFFPGVWSRPAASSLQVPVGQHRPSMVMRSLSESSTSRDSSSKHHTVKTNLYQREQSPASVRSVDLSSCLSDQTCSSILSSSSASSSTSSLASIGPTGQDNKLDMDPSYPELSTQVFHNVNQEAVPSVKVSEQPSVGSVSTPLRRQCEQPSVGSVITPLRRQCHRSVADEFAKGLSEQVMETALEQCRSNPWLRFCSYHQPIATGNWGCGAFQGNPQVKFVLQWIAASIARSPTLLYYTFGDPSLTKAQELAALISGMTVGQLASTLREYCHWITKNIPPPHHTQTAPRPAEGQPPQSLFDFIWDKFHTAEDR
ncbi:uncharacterized protein LOC131950431 isoform X2 [Physella acuta]|nr:uncharacterized protein LOC131950431 isoform X2 [Physella acuta]XP_059168558.1 uncharacterized protein LOC131950431 isoform X2 [Physella acuta]